MQAGTIARPACLAFRGLIQMVTSDGNDMQLLVVLLGCLVGTATADELNVTIQTTPRYWRGYREVYWSAA